MKRENRSVLYGVLGTAAAWGVFAVVHSLLATERSKSLVARVTGEERCEGFYRLGYNTASVVSVYALDRTLRRMPDRELYHVQGAARVPLAVARILLTISIVEGTRELGIGSFVGYTQLRAYLSNSRQAHGQQGSALEAEGAPQSSERLIVTGLYRYSRHPINFSSSIIRFLAPRMTAVSLTVAFANAAYSFFGSYLEEQRLLHRYPAEYSTYQQSRVPFFFPRFTLPPSQQHG